MKRALRYVPAVLLLAALIGVWELYVDLKGSTFSLILPSPHQVADSLYHDRGLLWSSFGVTAEEVLLGIAVACLVGFALAIAIHFSPVFRRAAYPLVVASQAVPVVILAPVLAFWLGFGLLPKARGRRPGVLLLGRGHDRRGTSVGRPRPAQADADLRLPAPAHLPAGRAPGGPARSVHRSQDRRRGVRDRRGLRRVERFKLGPRLPDPDLDSAAPERPRDGRRRDPGSVRDPLFGLLALLERVALPWAYEPRGERP